VNKVLMRCLNFALMVHLACGDFLCTVIRFLAGAGLIIEEGQFVANTLSASVAVCQKYRSSAHGE
jgi:hypothetical protein